MNGKLNWKGYSGGNRIEAIDGIKNAIQSGGGNILESNMFSDLALSLIIEIPEKKIPLLYQILQTQVSLSEFDPKSIDTESKNEWMILMNISFGLGQGKLKKEVPSVPG